ncbi:hypothetical protein LTR27_000186 [Elasticomyces elasticus]|nr:hypothetical protein LTR27_000186 [Elasticomyces elasticus]
MADSISGLREQIKANATLLFPSLVISYQAKNLTEASIHVPPTDAFEVVVVVTQYEQIWRASIIYHDHGPRRVATSNKAGSAVEALQFLLESTARALGEQYMKKEKEACAGGDDDGHEWEVYGYGMIDQDLIGDV